MTEKPSLYISKEEAEQLQYLADNLSPELVDLLLGDVCSKTEIKTIKDMCNENNRT
jgi:hypothetical protein